MYDTENGVTAWLAQCLEPGQEQPFATTYVDQTAIPPAKLNTTMNAVARRQLFAEQQRQQHEQLTQLVNRMRQTFHRKDATGMPDFAAIGEDVQIADAAFDEAAKALGDYMKKLLEAAREEGIKRDRDFYQRITANYRENMQKLRMHWAQAEERRKWLIDEFIKREEDRTKSTDETVEFPSEQDSSQSGANEPIVID